MTKLRGGIAGCGFFGQIQLEAWRRMEDAEIVAAADLDIDRARAAAPRAYVTAQAMLDGEELDFLDIATRPDQHLPLVRLAAARGLPVICQKPMAPSWDECVAMADAAQAAGTRLMIHENWRWQPWYRQAKRLIEEGAIGTPIAYRFRTRKRDGLGPEAYPSQPYFRAMPRLLIFETLVHHLDTARFLFGDLAAVYAQTRRLSPYIAAEDQAVITTTHSSGLVGAIDGHRYLDPDPDGPALGDCMFEGDESAIIIQGTGDVYVGRNRVWKNDVISGYRGDSVRATQQHFIDCLRSGAPFESNARAYLQTVRAVEACYESAASERKVRL